MVGAATKLSRATRPSHRSKHHYFVVSLFPWSPISALVEFRFAMDFPLQKRSAALSTPNNDARVVCI
jgi:hypothetical protein